MALGWTDGRIANEAEVDVDVIAPVRKRLHADPELARRARLDFLPIT